MCLCMFDACSLRETDARASRAAMKAPRLSDDSANVE